MVETALRPATSRYRSPYRAFAWPRGPKPRRRTELGLLLLSTAIVVALYVLASLGQTSKIPDHLWPFLGIVLFLAIVAHLANRWFAPGANPIILPIAALLNGIGYVIITRWEPHTEAPLQAAWTTVGIIGYVATLVVVRHTRDLDRYRYLLLLAAALLLLAPLVPHIGLRIGGARLWVHLGRLTFQPVELAKLLLCIFFASYFAENKELLSIPTARVGNRLVLDPRPLLPIVVAWGLALAIIAVEDDIGFAMLIFTLFIAMLWITTGRARYLMLGVLLFAAGAFASAHLFSQVSERVAVWLDPEKTAQTSGFQLIQAWYAMGTGGIGGTGLGLAHGITVPAITSDMVFAAVGEEMGLMGTSVIVICFLLLVGAGFRIAQSARSDFSRLVAAGLTIIVGFQAFFIMAGIMRLLPLTGITLPFVAYGGSSLVANYILIALMMRISDEGSVTTSQEETTGVHQPSERAFVAAR